MRLRTRIAVTFVLLLTTVMATALSIVSIANHDNAAREVNRQLDVGASVFRRLIETNRRQLTQAAQAVAQDFGFREAIAAHDSDTIISALQNSGSRIGAAMVVLTSLDGRVLAASGSTAKAGNAFLPVTTLLAGTRSADSASSIFVEGGRIFELVMTPVRSPLPIAYVAMGFELDAAAAMELSSVTGLDVTLSIGRGGSESHIVQTSAHSHDPKSETNERKLSLSEIPGAEVTATLSRSLKDARAPFDRLSNVLYAVAVASLLATSLAAVWLARNITRPLHNLTSAVDRIRAGEYDAVLKIERQDELGTLAEGMQMMQSAVDSRDQAIRQLAYRDSLTGLMNRTAFVDALREILAREPQTAVAVINIDRFRRINECLGYSVGDEVLKEVGQRLSGAPNIVRAVARLAGDQFAAFACLPPNNSDADWASALLMRLSEPIQVQKQPIDVTATLGIATSPKDASDVDELLRCAELALSRARRFKHSVDFYESSLKPATPDQLSLLGELQAAVDQDQLRLAFQPKIDLASSKVAGAEVLLRWQHPTRGLLSPGKFIPFAEQTGFIRRLTRWTLNAAIAQAALWWRSGSPLPLSVNISADDLADPTLDQRIAAALVQHELPPALLTLEVTESGFIDDPEGALRVLQSLSLLRVRLSIDDFGTGYSSLSYLTRMPVDEIKIDRSFIDGLKTDSDFVAIVRATIEMSHSLGLTIAAEGIETHVAANILQEMKCDTGQGYLYGRPMLVEELQRWLVGRDRMPVDKTRRQFDVEGILSLTDDTNILHVARPGLNRSRGRVKS
jgi:diguanylate cyclase (GGDEF)-like protein